jgi:hypothetical protein
MTKNTSTPIIVDSAKLLKKPTKKITEYSKEVDPFWVYSPVVNEVTYSRTMNSSFDLTSGLDPWGRKFLKAIFYDENRLVDKIALWRVLSSMTQTNVDEVYTVYGYTTVHGKVVKLRVTEVNKRDFEFLPRPHFVTYKDEELGFQPNGRPSHVSSIVNMPAYIV